MAKKQKSVTTKNTPDMPPEVPSVKEVKAKAKAKAKAKPKPKSKPPTTIMTMADPKAKAYLEQVVPALKNKIDDRFAKYILLMMLYPDKITVDASLKI